jgi:pimeloyl-ACP methyl ester carboxylesterase
MPSFRRAGLTAAVLAVPAALAYRFAVVYRTRAGFPRRHLPVVTPADLELPYEALEVPGPGGPLPAWFIPAMERAHAPGIVLLHGWESARDRTLPNALVLHAAGFHVLTVDVRGHGENPPETLPISGGEFAADARAAVDVLAARSEVTRIGAVGHSMGGIGVILAAADDPRIEALVVVAAPADPVRLTRQTFRLARLPLPDPVAWPLAWLTAWVYVRPRRHGVDRISAARAIARYRGPLLLVHGSDDWIVPLSHHRRLVRAARAGRAGVPAAPPVRTLVIPGGEHSWQYESEVYRTTVAWFLADALGGPLSPDEAAERAGAVPAERIPDHERPFAGLDRPSPRRRALIEILGAPVRPPDTEPEPPRPPDPWPSPS